MNSVLQQLKEEGKEKFRDECVYITPEGTVHIREGYEEFLDSFAEKIYAAGEEVGRRNLEEELEPGLTRLEEVVRKQTELLKNY